MKGLILNFMMKKRNSGPFCEMQECVLCVMSDMIGLLLCWVGSGERFSMMWCWFFPLLKWIQAKLPYLEMSFFLCTLLFLTIIYHCFAFVEMKWRWMWMRMWIIHLNLQLPFIFLPSKHISMMYYKLIPANKIFKVP